MACISVSIRTSPAVYTNRRVFLLTHAGTRIIPAAVRPSRLPATVRLITIVSEVVSDTHSSAPKPTIKRESQCGEDRHPRTIPVSRHEHLDQLGGAGFALSRL